MEGERKRECRGQYGTGEEEQRTWCAHDISHTRGSIAITLVVMTVVVLMAVIVIDVNPR